MPLEELIEEKSARASSTPIRENQSPPKKGKIMSFRSELMAFPKLRLDFYGERSTAVRTLCQKRRLKLRSNQWRNSSCERRLCALFAPLRRKKTRRKEHQRPRRGNGRQQSWRATRMFSRRTDSRTERRFSITRRRLRTRARGSAPLRTETRLNRRFSINPKWRWSKKNSKVTLFLSSANEINHFPERANGGAGCNQFEMTLVEEDREEQKRRHQENMMKFERIFN